MSENTPQKSVLRSDSFWPHIFDPFKGVGTMIADFFAPNVDASHGEKAYEINVELPGVDEKDIDVKVRGNNLVIMGEKKSETETKDKDYYFSERHYGAFQRSFQLPSDVVADKIDAHFENGVLKITLPKLTPKAEDIKKIEIRKS